MGTDHFKGKEAISHVVEAQAKGIISASEIHGIETPGHIAAAADAARDTSLLFLLLLPLFQAPLPLFLFLLGWTLWRAGRAAWLGWMRLERLHRVLEQEKWEIEHNREQEREELKELYKAKGFDGKLLEDVVDVLMADGDRLLRVMVEEELGLTLESQDHPLKQGFGAAIGAFLSGAVILAALYWSLPLAYLSAFLMIGISAIILAYFAKNKLVSAVVWNLSLATVSLLVLQFTLKFFQ